MNLNQGQFPPDKNVREENVVRVIRPKAQVNYSKEKNTLLRGPHHIPLKGPDRLSGRGKASEVANILGAIREAHSPND